MPLGIYCSTYIKLCSHGKPDNLALDRRYAAGETKKCIYFDELLHFRCFLPIFNPVHP